MITESNVRWLEGKTHIGLSGNAAEIIEFAAKLWWNRHHKDLPGEINFYGYIFEVSRHIKTGELRVRRTGERTVKDDFKISFTRNTGPSKVP